MANEQDKKRLAKNTLVLYIRTLITMLLGLLSSRLILNTLGVDNYGIYNLIGGIVAMFSVISSTLSSSTQRFINFELGKNNESRIQKIFSTSLNIHLLLSIIVLILGESIGLYFINNGINISEDRMYAANIVFQFSLATFVIQILGTPYNALIIAHERLDIFAYGTILEAVLKLILIIVVAHAGGDSLVYWASSLFFISLIVSSLYYFFCRCKYKESMYILIKDRIIYKQVLSYTGWNFLGITSSVFSTQGINIISNIFFGVKINAARGMATQVEGVINSFVNNFSTSLNPQIVKAYASSDIHYFNSLLKYGTKYSYFLLLIIAIPILLETQELLTLWLRIVPPYALVFVRLTVIFLLFQILSNTLITAINATGKIKIYQVWISIFLMFNFVCSLFLFKLGASPTSSYMVIVINSIVCIILRVVILNKIVKINVKDFLLNVVARCLLIMLITISVSYYFQASVSIGGFFIEIIFSEIVCLTLIASIGFSKKEKAKFIRTIKDNLKKIND